MINLIVPNYCQSCEEFEPIVAQRPEQIETNYGDLALYGDTYVECEHRCRCRTIYEYLKKEKENSNGNNV